MSQSMQNVVIIGAGIGGLATALRLSQSGMSVTVLERHATPGGKMRTVPSPAGPVDAGPTVLTMKPVFEALFQDCGARLDDHVTLIPAPVLARHFWRDGTVLDLMADPAESVANVRAAFGARAGRDFAAFSKKAQQLYQAFEAPMMLAAVPSQTALSAQVMKRPALIAAMSPHLNLAQSLHKQFREPRLAQMFARYSTYVGGLPSRVPALLALIWHAEAQGVWHVKGGMHQLARAIEALATARGVTFRYDAQVSTIVTQNGRVTGVEVDGAVIPADSVVFNGDPRALRQGLLGDDLREAVPETATDPRSLSAHVLSFAAQAAGPAGANLAGHNVFFADDPAREYAPLEQGRDQDDPTLYVCAQDRFAHPAPDGPERFEIIMNAPPCPDGAVPNPEDMTQCQTRILHRLQDFGLDLTPLPGPEAMTGPPGFAGLFPASNGALYGRSPEGMMAAFKRPTAHTAVRGLYLAGGGAHPGAGVPMATLSARHAAAAILAHRTST